MSQRTKNSIIIGSLFSIIFLSGYVVVCLMFLTEMGMASTQFVEKKMAVINLVFGMIPLLFFILLFFLSRKIRVR